MFGHVVGVNPAAGIVGFGEPQPLFVEVAGRNDAAVDVVECAELHHKGERIRVKYEVPYDTS